MAFDLEVAFEPVGVDFVAVDIVAVVVAGAAAAAVAVDDDGQYLDVAF